MLSKIIDLFYTKSQEDSQETQEDENIIASITYYVKSGSTKPSVNIELQDYDQECCEAMCAILNTLGSDGFYAETINILKTALMQEEREDILLYFFTHLSDQIREGLIKSHSSQMDDEPCVKPSDALR
jgi:hypothetical protein